MINTRFHIWPWTVNQGKLVEYMRNTMSGICFWQLTEGWDRPFIWGGQSLLMFIYSLLATEFNSQFPRHRGNLFPCSPSRPHSYVAADMLQPLGCRQESLRLATAKMAWRRTKFLLMYNQEFTNYRPVTLLQTNQGQQGSTDCHGDYKYYMKLGLLSSWNLFVWNCFGVF